MDRTARLSEKMTSESGQISSWLVKLVVFLGIAGILIVEIGGILVAKGTAVDTAEGAASEAAFAIKARGVSGDPETVARQFADTKDCEFVKIEYNQAAATVSVTVKRTAKTYITHRIGPLKKYTVSVATGTRSYAGPG